MTRNICRGLLALSLGVAVLTTAAQTCNPYAIAAAPTGRYADPGDGTVTDIQTGLMWKKCSEGLIWSGTNGTCTGAAVAFTWGNALSRVSNVNGNIVGQYLGHNDWRLPNIKELASLMEHKCFNPAINATELPNTQSSYYWSSSPLASSPTFAWGVDFGGGIVDNDNITYSHFVRLVRGGR
jgi:Protein of unknown function (DUF1566)